MARTILIVDDDVASADLLADILEDAGFEVALALSGARAIRALERNEVRPDVAVVDQHLGDMRGVELLPHLVERGIGTVAISADADALRAAEPMCAATARKPLPPGRIVDLVFTALRGGGPRRRRNPPGRPMQQPA